MRGLTYRWLNEERRRVGLPVLTLDQLNALSLWELSRLLYLAKQKADAGQMTLEDVKA